jgi:outer membrane receptor protein involved in Fe transport
MSMIKCWLSNSFAVFMLFLASGSCFAQVETVTISGQIKDSATHLSLPYVTAVLKMISDSSMVSGSVTNEEGRFSLSNVKPGEYYLQASFVGYGEYWQRLYVGRLSEFLDLGVIEMQESLQMLNEVEITAKRDEVGRQLDKKTFDVDANVSQNGGSVLQAMQSLPGVTTQDGNVQLRGSDQVVVLIDGKQTALTGFNGQSGLDNIPASAIEKIEIINNPSAKYDANGNAGIINIVSKKEVQTGFSGKAGLTTGLGALWVKKENLPGIRAQYQYTPKVNPSLALNYRKGKTNFFFLGDHLYTETLNKNEFVTRTYDDGTVIRQQSKRNRNTGFTTLRGGMDWNINSNNSLTLSGLYGREVIIDRGDQPFFDEDLEQRQRLWQFLEDEVKTTVMASAAYKHIFKQAGHALSAGVNYTFHREDERYFFNNILPTYIGKDSFKLLSDENVADFNLDYQRPLKHGRFEAGAKLRWRLIPTNMEFQPGINSPLDTNAGGEATYKELIPAMYGTYVLESRKYEAEVGLRMEYVKVNYDVNPNHNTYNSDGYEYIQPFPNIRLAYKISELQKISLFYNRRVDRPNEVDIRIFPKYDDAEIIKVGNPALGPQYTQSLELGYKKSANKGYFYGALYGRLSNGTITRISSSVPGSTLIYSIFQNAGRSQNTGVELIFARSFGKQVEINLNTNVYYSHIDRFIVENEYPVQNSFTAGAQEIISGSAKLNALVHLPKNTDVQITAIYLAPDIIPQGTIDARFSLDLGVKKSIQKGKGELFVNATDLLNTMVIRKDILGDGFSYISEDFYETQVIRMGYNYKF